MGYADAEAPERDRGVWLSRIPCFPMKIIFGLSLDRPVCPLPEWVGDGVHIIGPRKLLLLMEGYLGLQHTVRDMEYLRVEEYRQALRAYVEATDGEVFFRHSFFADPFAVATELLSRRDELLLAGWDFQASESMPDRLVCIAAIERGIREGRFPLSPGFAERFDAVLQILPYRRCPIDQIELLEPRHLFPVHWRRLLAILEARGIGIAENTALANGIDRHPSSDEDSDLKRFQRLLVFGRLGENSRLRGDGSLILLKGRRDTDLAAYFAAWSKRHPDWAPVLLLPDLSGTLDYALVQEGLPSLGLQSASLARPALQALKLLPVFLWQPLDLYRLLEFVSLPIKPLEEELAARIARKLADLPGVMGESWRAMIGEYFRDLESGEYISQEPLAVIRKQYQFWFERRRYDSAGVAPKEDALEMYRYLAEWAGEKYMKGEGGISLLPLRVQAQRIVELLEALPEPSLSLLELERIVRTIYEAAPLQMREQEKGSFPYAQEAGAIPGSVDSLVWWNFCQGDPAFIFSRWSTKERAYLIEKGACPDGPQRENALLLWQKRRPVLLAQQRLILVLPAFSEGGEMVPHSLLGDLEAGFDSLEPITLDIESPAPQRGFPKLPGYVEVPYRQLGQPAPFIRLRQNTLLPREEETFSSLETLLYYPHRWVFRYALRLRKSAILSIVEDNTLYGNLAHRLFEGLLNQPGMMQWEKADVFGYIARESPGLFAREGSVLLLYGREPARVQFVKKVQYAAWSLVSLIKNNNWEPEGAEMPLSGNFAGLRIHGRADIVLRRGMEKVVLDVKWGGHGYRESLLRNREDLQLALYTELLSGQGPMPYSAYFIVENGRMIARNQLAFQDITPVDPGADHVAIQQEILQRMQATYAWRLEQLQQGQVEVRCAQTEAALNEHYQESLLEILEMRKDNGRFEEYQTLINLVR